MKLFKTRFLLGVFVPLLVVLLSFGGVAQALGTWNIVPSPNPSTSNVFNAVSAVSANDVWAVGYQSNTNPALIEHWNGTKWSVVPTPAVPNSTEYYLRSVAAISANDVWVVGNYFGSSDQNDYTLIEHWNGTRWSIVTSPNPSPTDNFLSGVAAVSKNDVWAVGWYENNALQRQQVLIEHWNGTAWSAVKSPTLNSIYMNLTGLAVVSASDIWGVGDYIDATDQGKTLIEHWNGSAWSIVTSPNISSGASLLAASAVSAKNVWAVGNDGLIEHWNGTAWSVVKSPNQNPLAGLAVLSASDIWAVGSQVGPNGVSHTLIEHWNGTSWSVVKGPIIAGYSSLNGVARVPGTSTCWAVGTFFPNTIPQANQTLTEYYA